MWNGWDNLILEETFFETHMIDVKCKLVYLGCHDGKKMKLKMTMTPMVGRAKLNLVSMDQMKNYQIMVTIRLEQLQGTHGEARKDRPSQNHICGWHKDVLTNGLFKKLLPRNGKQLCWMKYWVLELCGEKWSWWTNMRKVKAIPEW